ncbi:hypothetical protein [Bacillus sp. Marseille-P3661]|uniref:hypothetical protein n=1 Tax=Bacillus sp. Marseille-P3661 TaxID=1936234 RepID=UPI00115997E0|nr:hypothetical protein [Bacillus sp. Marseille-P3661]
MYRPTVRMDDVYKDYLEELTEVTTLDRNQLIRLALFSAPFNRLFIAQVETHLKDNSSLPSAKWEVFDHGYWLEQTYKSLEGENDVNVNVSGAAETRRDSIGIEREGNQVDRRIQPQPRREGTVFNNEPIKCTGGIRFSL